MSGYHWIDLYKKILAVIGALTFLAAIAIFGLSVFALLSGAAPVRERLLWVVLNIVVSPLVVFISGVSCLALAEFIELAMEIRYNVIEVNDEIKAARKRQAARLKPQSK